MNVGHVRLTVTGAGVLCEFTGWPDSRDPSRTFDGELLVGPGDPQYGVLRTISYGGPIPWVAKENPE